jgi:HSF-type DNA-binding
LLNTVRGTGNTVVVHKHKNSRSAKLLPGSELVQVNLFLPYNMTMTSNWNSSYLSALLGNANAQSMIGLSQSQGVIGPGNLLSGANDAAAVRALRNSVLLSQLVQQQQVEEQQRMLLAQHLATVGGISGNQSLDAMPDSQRLLALLRLEQEQLHTRQHRLQELQAALLLPGGNLSSLAFSSIPSLSNVEDSALAPNSHPSVDAPCIRKQGPPSNKPAPATVNPEPRIIVQEVQPQPSKKETAVGRNDVLTIPQGHNDILAIPQGHNDMLAIPQGRKRKGRSGTFPQKLHQMLSDLVHQEHGSDIASFLPHGRAFAIHKPREFANSVMPRYFRMSRFSSFQR